MKGESEFRVPGPRWLYAATAAFLVFLLALKLFGPTPKVVDPNVPDARVLAQLREVLPDDSFAAREEKLADFEAACSRAQAQAARAIYVLLKEEYADTSAGFDSWSNPEHDRSYEVVAWMLGRYADADLRAELVRALTRPELHQKFRRALVVALCRREHRSALPALLDRVLDRNEDKKFRRDVLIRLHRFRGERPERLRELLALPFADLDFVAAGTLGRWGDAVGAALIRDGLLHRTRDDYLIEHLAIAVNQLSGVTLPLPETDRPGGDDNEKWRRAQVRPHLQALADAVDLPDVPAPQPASFEELLAAGEEFDVAAAAMVAAGYDADEIASDVRRIDRLAEYLRPRIEGTSDPEERIAILNAVLLPQQMVFDMYSKQSLRVSYLPVVLRTDTGNCLGYSSLYVALGQRLGLPLYGVGSPGHCFVRYDDGDVPAQHRDDGRRHDAG